MKWHHIVVHVTNLRYDIALYAIHYYGKISFEFYLTLAFDQLLNSHIYSLDLGRLRACGRKWEMYRKSFAGGGEGGTRL